MYIAALAGNDNQRQHLHDVAMISFLPDTAQFPSYCSLIRLKWAGYIGSGHCDAEEEIIDWALQAIRTRDDDAVILRIASVLSSWERDFDERLATALKSLCLDCCNVEIRKAAMKALVAHSATRDPAFEAPASGKSEPPPEGERLDTRKIILPRPPTGL